MRLILAASMPRAGSTWMYNAARLVLLQSPQIAQSFAAGWVGDLDKLPQKRTLLIKIHDYSTPLLMHTSKVIYCYRDIRDALASLERKFGTIPTLDLADHMVEQYTHWSRHAHYLTSYEAMMQNKQKLIQDLAKLFKVSLNQPDKLLDELEQLSYHSPGETQSFHQSSYNTTNLYHPQHITDGSIGSWQKSLSPKLEEEIINKHRDWFIAQGYLNEQS